MIFRKPTGTFETRLASIRATLTCTIITLLRKTNPNSKRLILFTNPVVVSITQVSTKLIIIIHPGISEVSRHLVSIVQCKKRKKISSKYSCDFSASKRVHRLKKIENVRETLEEIVCKNTGLKEFGTIEWRVRLFCQIKCSDSSSN